MNLLWKKWKIQKDLQEVKAEKSINKVDGDLGLLYFICTGLFMIAGLCGLVAAKSKNWGVLISCCGIMAYAYTVCKIFEKARNGQFDKKIKELKKEYRALTTELKKHNVPEKEIDAKLCRVEQRRRKLKESGTDLFVRFKGIDADTHAALKIKELQLRQIYERLSQLSDTTGDVCPGSIAAEMNEIIASAHGFFAQEQIFEPMVCDKPLSPEVLDIEGELEQVRDLITQQETKWRLQNKRNAQKFKREYPKQYKKIQRYIKSQKSR